MTKFQNVLVLSILSSFLIFPRAGLSNDEVPPSIPDLESNTDLASAFSNWSEDLQSFFSKKGRGYTVVYGIGALDTTDRGSSRYIESIQAAYKQALMDAYTRLSTATNPGGISIATSDKSNLSRSTGNAMPDRIDTECRQEAQKAYQAHLLKEKKDRERRESLLGSIAARIRGEKPPAESNQAEPKPDFIHTCLRPGPTFEQVSKQNQQLTDILSGGRIWASVVHNNQLGIILMRSPDSSEVAKVLRNQLAPARIHASAADEVRSRVREELRQFDGKATFGNVGTRMMKLSNGEWAIYSFGASQVVSTGSGGFMAAVTQDSNRQQSIAEAQSELARFSSLSLTFNNQSEEVRSVRTTYRLEYNVTKDTVNQKVDEKETFGAIINTLYSSKSSLTLRGSRDVSTQLLKADGLDYYLSVVAWSPSIMASQLADRSRQDSAGDEAARSGRYQVPGVDRSPKDSSSSGPSRIILPKQDW
jgi:hypothetical protein